MLHSVVPWGGGEQWGIPFAQKHCASVELERERRGGEEEQLGRAGDSFLCKLQ